MANLQDLKYRITDELQRARDWKQRGNGATGYCCPLCHSGESMSSSSTGALSIKSDGIHWHCFGCQRGGDIYDLFMLRDGLDASEAAAAVLRKYGDGKRNGTPTTDHAPTKQAKPAQPLKDYRDFLNRCHDALPGSIGESYFIGRGFTPETLERFNLGFDAAHQSIVIPYPGTANGYYVTRSIRGEKRFFKPNADDAGEEPVFNADALYNGARFVFVVESQICAISIEQAGGAAVAIGGTGGQKLLNQLKEKPTAAALIVCLDNDQNTPDKQNLQEETERKARELTERLIKAGVFAVQDNSICGEMKDPNDALQADAAAFETAIRRSIELTDGAANAERSAAITAYLQESAAGAMDGFGKSIQESFSTPPIPTGFDGLDKKLGGGLFEGLYTLGAISSLGKTSFALQIIDQIAESGHDCLIFSLEMARYELMAKSISRQTFIYTQRAGISKDKAKTTRGITNGANYQYYDDQDFGIIDAAEQAYRSRISPRIWIFEGIGNIGVNEIRAAINRHVDLTGRKPIVLIDYLQILAPYIDPMHPTHALTDKQTVDKNVLELKRISRDYKIPVICISSFNRDSYSAPVNTAAFKESGAVEYSADVLIGLQYTGMERQEKSTGKIEGDNDPERLGRIAALFKENDEKAARGEGVQIDIKILKNRNGGRGLSDPMTFYPKFNTFIENTGGFTPVNVNAGGIFGKPMKAKTRI